MAIIICIAYALAGARTHLTYKGTKKNAHLQTFLQKNFTNRKNVQLLRGFTVVSPNQHAYYKRQSLREADGGGTKSARCLASEDAQTADQTKNAGGNKQDNQAQQMPENGWNRHFAATVEQCAQAATR